jgi:hypothetical protein
MVPCPTEYGRRNPPASVVDMLDEQRSRSISKSKAEQMPAEELVDKIITGTLHRNTKASEFQRSYADMAARIQAEEAQRLRALREGHR